MGKFSIEVDDEIAKKFKVKIIELYGQLRGHVDKCFEEAMKDWIDKKVV